jgi:D-alanyl-D-alanine carboxypeptidase
MSTPCRSTVRRPTHGSAARAVLAASALLLVAAACGSDAEGSAKRETSAAIDSLVELTLSVAPAPGIGLAVVHRGDTLAMRGYGVANLEHGVPVTDRTVFALASTTKPMTAAAVLTLAAEGRLALDRPVRELLPSYAGLDRSITVHHLLSHTSGIPDYMRNWERYGDRLPLSATEMRAVADEPLQFPPGEALVYSNSGYYLLGEIIEAVAWPETFVEVLARTQWAPLGLETFGRCDPERVVPGRAQGYTRRPRATVHAEAFVPNEIGSDGGVCGTARDLVRWARAVFSGELLPPEWVARMTSRTVVRGREMRQGYGIRVRSLDDRRLHYWHTGGMPGFTAVLAHYPDEDLTIVAFSNGPLNLLPLQDAIARIVLGPVPGSTG